jgi:Xaa-Pro aminopeptidase
MEQGIIYPHWRFRNTQEDDLVIQESGEPFNLMRNIPMKQMKLKVWWTKPQWGEG